MLVIQCNAKHSRLVPTKTLVLAQRVGLMAALPAASRVLVSPLANVGFRRAGDFGEGGGAVDAVHVVILEVVRANFLFSRGVS